MSREERFETRERSYGLWHRVKSIARFIGTRQAEELAMVDLDSVLFAEHDYPTKLPLCLVEVGRDIGQEKPAGVIRKLAQLADVPAYVCLYTPSNDPNPASPNWPDIEGVRIKRLHPHEEEGWRELTPAEWARALVQIRGWQLRRFKVQEASNDPTY